MRSFCSLHPAALAAYLACAVACACVVPSLPLQLLAFAGAAAACLSTAGRQGAGPVAAAALLAALVAAANPLFNTQGATVLAQPLGRPYTWEALALGASTGLMAATMLLWFACVGFALGADALLRLGGKAAPRIGLVASLTAQMVPRFGRTAARVGGARAAAGVALDLPREGRPPAVAARVREGAAVLVTVASDGLEGAMVTAASMEARGFGTGPRTSLAAERFTMADGAFLAVSGALLAAFVAGSAVGGSAASAPEGLALATAGAYGGFAFLPALVNAAGEVRWLFLRQSI